MFGQIGFHKKILIFITFLGFVFAQSVVTFDIDGVENCGFVSINGSFPDDSGATWSGWGAHTDNGMQQTVAPGSYEFQVLCVDTSINEWWNNIYAASTVLTSPLGSECDFNPTDEWNNYGFTVGTSDITVSYCAGSCDASCEGGGDTGGGDTGGGDLLSEITFDLDGLDDCGFVSVTGTWDSWSGWGANTDTDMSASIPAGDHEFVILCVNTAGEWWNDIWGSSTVHYAPIDGSCWNGNVEYPNYTLNVDGSGDSVTVSYCAGSCDASCEGGGDTGGGDTGGGGDEDGIIFSGAFGGTVVEGNTYTNPSGSEGWAGFANEDVGLYPFSFTDGGEITFTGATSGTDVGVYFRFEYNPYPDTEPSFITETVTISGTDEASYSVGIPAQGGNTYSSFLLYVTTLDAPVTLTDVAVTSSEYVDPCSDITCGDGQECVDGECVGTTQIDLPVDFESSTINYTTTDFGGNVSSLVIDPEDPSNLAIQIIKTSQAATWAGTTIGTPAGFANNIPLSLDNSIMTVQVWSPEAGTPIRLKVEDSTDPTHTCETETNTTVSGWEIIEFDFENQVPGTEFLYIGLDFGWTYNMASIFFNFGSEGNGETYYFDDVEMCDACDSGGTGDGGGDLSSQVTFDLDGLDDCGFVSVTGTWDSWSGWGANTDTDMSASIPAGDHEFVILCVNTAGEWWNDIWGSSTVHYAPIDGSCWNGNAEFPNYSLNVNGSGDSATISYCAGTCDATCSEIECTAGDVNADGSINILDVVSTVNYILQGSDDFPTDCADINEDGVINILDIVATVNIILNARSVDATSARFIKDGDALNLNADGFIGGVQMTLSHGSDFSIELTDRAMVADYRTDCNETTLIIVAPESDELFITDGEYEIVDVIVANSAGQMDVIKPNSFELTEAYPNPFNPSTSINLSIPEAGHVSVMVYNVMGQLVSTLADGQMDASDYSFTWDASASPSGVYLITATTANHTSTQKVMLLK